MEKYLLWCPQKLRALYLVFSYQVHLGLGFLDHCVSGSDFTNKFKARARIFKLGSRRLGKARILPFVTPNNDNSDGNDNPMLPNVAYIIPKHSHVLYFSERCRNDFENLPMAAYHHPNNLSDTFVRAQLPETNNCHNDRVTPGSFRCSM